ncbi:hypothetical protein FP742_02240 [Vibrio parahaemolyticus]|uniref:Uncharacterized protein n=2 Tax=Vibrio parahaemolyticus TaxID=670 RepID=A0A2R9VVL2_VIBPH|nr:hypothetical protein RK51_020395 [Vibrio parahaemolyticus]QGG35658.1 hypothetical protein GH799_21515 [Vibrio parahaemolyticus 10329]BAC62045.1 hypothetical protein [Vibrio parahaemolyticus RIMD 2210633]AUW38956.1 hypothetical protein AL464_25305 [Vibrio parahaemolyticus]AVJ53999.1 hypothetical protein A6J30_25815 [Vibrio parahaemolyticus]
MKTHFALHFAYLDRNIKHIFYSLSSLLTTQSAHFTYS